MSKALSLLKTCETEDQYDVSVYGTKEYFAGPSDLRKCICRFCGRTRPEVEFKRKNAHAIPEAPGNKLVFCNDECRTCNRKLSVVENNLINYLNYRRAQGKIKGKKNKIITSTGQNYSIVGSTGQLEISNEAIIDKRNSEIKVKYLDANLISHLGIYRALSKIAIDLLPDNHLSDFITTIDWIKGYVSPYIVPNVYFAYRNLKVSQPIARLFLRKENSDKTRYPHCLVVIDLIDLRFFYILPFAKSDGTSFLSSNAINDFMPFLAFIDDGNIDYDFIDMSQREGKYSHVTDSLKECETDIVDSRKFDIGKERNPNNADFPNLDLNKVNILSISINYFDINSDENISREARIEFSDIIVDQLKCVGQHDLSKFQLNLQFTIRQIVLRSEIFKVSVSVIASHSNPIEVCSIDKNEISFQLIEYMIGAGIDKIRVDEDKVLPNFNFESLKRMIIENKMFVLPKDHIDAKS